MKKYVLLLVSIFLVACTGSDAEVPLNKMADALADKNPTLFLEQMDMSRYATAQVHNQTNASEPLKALDAVGKMLGIGGLSDLIGAVSDMERKENEYFTHGISTGELELMCKESKKTNCPWVATSLRNAELVEISDVAAVARITTPTNISTWLSLAKINNVWKVVGSSELQSVAKSYAEAKYEQGKGTKAAPPAANEPAPPPAKKKEETVRF